jgi:hypothetical protein
MSAVPRWQNLETDATGYLELHRPLDQAQVKLHPQATRAHLPRLRQPDQLQQRRHSQLASGASPHPAGVSSDGHRVLDLLPGGTANDPPQHPSRAYRWPTPTTAPTPSLSLPHCSIATPPLVTGRRATTSSPPLPLYRRTPFRNDKAVCPCAHHNQWRRACVLSLAHPSLEDFATSAASHVTSARRWATSGENHLLAGSHYMNSPRL